MHIEAKKRAHKLNLQKERELINNLINHSEQYEFLDSFDNIWALGRKVANAKNSKEKILQEKKHKEENLKRKNSLKFDQMNIGNSRSLKTLPNIETGSLTPYLEKQKNRSILCHKAKSERKLFSSKQKFKGKFKRQFYLKKVLKERANEEYFKNVKFKDLKNFFSQQSNPNLMSQIKSKIQQPKIANLRKTENTEKLLSFMSKRMKSVNKEQNNPRLPKSTSKKVSKKSTRKFPTNSHKLLKQRIEEYKKKEEMEKLARLNSPKNENSKQILNQIAENERNSEIQRNLYQKEFKEKSKIMKNQNLEKSRKRHIFNQKIMNIFENKNKFFRKFQEGQNRLLSVKNLGPYHSLTEASRSNL
jgi:hypothetical protein